MLAAMEPRSTDCCPYACEGGWLPLPNSEGRAYYPQWVGEREWWTVTTTYNGATVGERHRLGENGRCVDCRAEAPPREPDLFASATACPFCNEEELLDDDEPQTGLSLAAMHERLLSAGARVEVWPDYWTLEGHWIRLDEIGPGIWQAEVSCPNGFGCCYSFTS